MPTDSQQENSRTPILEFKSSTYSVPVLVLASNDLATIEQQLQNKIHIAPEFFKNSPLIFDLQELNSNDIDINVTKLTETVRKLDLMPIGIRGGTAQQNKQAQKLGIPIHTGHYSAPTLEKQKQKTQEPEPETEHTPEPQHDFPVAKLITHPVRSGQRIYATGDLIILAQVSPGSEILAEGNIHVYGSLRGRAFAGVQGNTEARIFCLDLQAELISIAGNYKVYEDLNGSVLNQPVQVYLQNHSLIIKEL